MESIDIFPWDDHFDTGLEIIDTQHKKLVELVNLLARAVAFKSDELHLNQIFDELLKYTVYHFDSEEMIWEKYVQNDLMEEEHKKIHQEFVDTIARLKFEANERSTTEIAQETLAFLVQWLASHILETDRFMAYVVLSLQAGNDRQSAKQHATQKMGGFTRTLIDLILSIYETLSTNTLQLMYEIKNQKQLEEKVRYQIEYQNILLDLSSSFIHISLGDIEATVNAALEKMRLFVNADRIYIFDYDFDKRTMSNTYERCGVGISPYIDELQAISMDTVPEWVYYHIRGEHIHIEDVLALPEGNLRTILEPQGIKSLLTLPLLYEGKCYGFIGFDAVYNYHDFNADEIRLLEIFATLLAHLGVRKQTEDKNKKLEEKLRNREEYQRTVLNNFPFLVWLKDQEGKYLSVNTPFVDATDGLTFDEIIGNTDFDIWPSDLAEGYRADDLAVMQSGAFKSIEEYVEIDEKRVWFETYKSPIIVDGVVLGTVGFSRDITERKINETEILEAKNLLSIIINTIPVRIFWKDNNLNYLGCNTLFAHDSGMEDPSLVVGKTDFELGWAQQASLYREDDLHVIKSGAAKLLFEEPQTAADGKTIWLTTSKVPLRNHNNEIIGVVGTYDDITARKEAELKLELAASVFTHATEGIMITTDDGTIVDVNEAFTNITGYSKSEAIGKKPSILKSGQNSKEFYSKLWEGLLTKGHWYGEIWNRRANGEAYIQTITITAVLDEKGKIRNFISLFSDITLIQEHRNQLEHIAHYDALTGLANRVLLADRLNQAMIQTSRRGNKLAVAYLDLDGFKEINDLYGHEAGDKLLIGIATNMKKALREGDTLARIGGDEFVVVLDDLEDTHASIQTLERLLKAASEPIHSGHLKLQASASLGVTLYPQEQEVQADQLLRQADQAMYNAKQEGKNRFSFFDIHHDRIVRDKHETLGEIKNALHNNEFVLFYQPKVNMRTGEIIGLEALIRWDHPEDGIRSPASFLPFVEDHHMGVQLGEWVIKKALSQIQLWEKEGFSFPVSVNVSARQFLKTNFVSRLRELLELFPDISPSMLEIEVLETSALENMGQMSAIIQECKELGIKFALDDFGTGYSSLSYLKHLPVSILKIDQSFVRDMLHDPEDLAIVESILGLGNAFRRSVVAEGIEDIEQGVMLLQLGCEWGQGYGIARPMRPADVIPWSKTWCCYPQWLASKAVSREKVQVLYAMVDHRSWVGSIEMHVRNKQTAVRPLDSGTCRFGEWLNSVQGSDCIDEHTYKKIDQLHQKIHLLGTLLAEAKHSEDKSALENQLHKLFEYHKSLNDILTRLLDEEK